MSMCYYIITPPVASNASSCVQKNAKDENPISQMRMYIGPFRPFQVEITAVRILERIFRLYNNCADRALLQIVSVTSAAWYHFGASAPVSRCHCHSGRVNSACFSRKYALIFSPTFSLFQRNHETDR